MRTELQETDYTINYCRIMSQLFAGDKMMFADATSLFCSGNDIRTLF